MYTTLFESSYSGAPSIRDMIFDHPEDPEVYNLKGTFLWGKNVKVTVNIDIQKPTGGNFTAYFPKGKWYDYEGH